MGHCKIRYATDQLSEFSYVWHYKKTENCKFIQVVIHPTGRDEK